MIHFDFSATGNPGDDPTPTPTPTPTPDSDSRFSRLEVDDDPAPPAARAHVDATIAAVRTVAALGAAAPAPAAPEALPALLAGQERDTAQSYGDIDAEGRARAIRSGLLAARHGLIPNEATFFSWGTRGQWGDAAAKARLELRARPLIAEAAASVTATVAAEQRKATPRQLTELTYTDSDRLTRRVGKPADGARMTARAFAQLLSRAGAAPYAATYLGHESTPAAMRADHVRHWLGKATDTVQVKGDRGQLTGETHEEPRDAVILSKLDAQGERYVYGVVSDSYARYDLDAVIRDVQAAVPPTSRVAVSYNPESTRWRADITIGAEFEPVVGDIHRVTLRVRSSDAGGGSVTVELYAERARCLNFSKIKLRGKLGRVRHVGADVAAKVRALLDVQAEALHDFSAVWADANRDALIGEALQGDGEARDVFRALIKAGHLPAPEGEEVAVERYFGAWLKEPGHTRADFVNAATRAAHEAPWASPWTGEAIEEAASDLLYQTVHLNPTWRVEASA